MKKIKNFFKKYWWIIWIIIIGLGLFYWYELRPSFIKKSCYNQSREKAIEKANREDKMFFKEDYEFYYKMCLEKNGL